MATSKVPFTELAGLAAARAALDPNRRAWQSDVLISSAITILTGKGSLSERELLTHLRELWVTSAVDMAHLRSALVRAKDAGLIEEHVGHATSKWAPTAASAAEANIDRDWARGALSAFEVEIGDRLQDVYDKPLEEGRLPRLSVLLVSALIRGSRRVFEGIASTGNIEKLIRPALDFDAINDDLRQKVKPPGLAEALCALGVAAVDPADGFGKEMMRLIVTGQVLHGLATRRDIGSQMLSTDGYLLLDTSALFYRLEPKGGRVLDGLLDEASQSHVVVAVSQEILDEWERLWVAADEDWKIYSYKATRLPSFAGRLAANGVVRAWYELDAFGDGPTWDVFEANFRNARKWLAKRGVVVADPDEVDVEVRDSIHDELMRMTEEEDRGFRTDNTATVDGVSAGIIRHRRLTTGGPLPKAWFVARESMTNRAYRGVVTDDTYPLSMMPETALLVLSSVRSDEPDARRDLAEVVGDALILGSFLGVAASYDADDLAEIAGAFAQAEDELDTAQSLRADVLALTRHSPAPVADILRTRARRRNRQVESRAAQVEAVASNLQQRIDAAEKRGRATGATAEADLSERITKLRRTIALILTLAAMIGADVGLGLAGFRPAIVLIAGLMTVIAGAEGFRWVVDSKVRTSLFVAGVAATLAWTLLAAALGATNIWNTGDHAKPAQFPSPSSSSHKS